MSALDESLFQPHKPGELFRRGVAETLRDGGAAWIAAFGVLLPSTVLAVAGQYLIWRAGAGPFMEQLQGGTLDPTKLDMGEMFSAIALMVGIGLAAGIASMITQFAGAMIVGRMVAERALGRTLGAAAAWDFALVRAGKVVGGALVMMLVIVAASTIGSVPGGILASVIGMATGSLQPGQQPPAFMQIIPLLTVAPVVVVAMAYLASMASVMGVESLGAFGSLSRSFRLVGGQFWHAVGVVVLGAAAFVLPASVLGGLGQTSLLSPLKEAFGATTVMVAVGGVSAVLSSLLAPFMYAIEAVLYFDLRSRQREEPFGAYELAVDLGGEIPEGVAPPWDTAAGSPGAGPSSDHV